MRRAIINIFSGGAGYVVPMLLNLISTPLIIRLLGEESYGIQTLSNIIIGYFMVADMGLDIPITKFIAENNASFRKEDNKKTINTTLLIYLLIGLLGMVSIISLSFPLGSTFFRISKDLQSVANQVFAISGVGFFAMTLNIWCKAIFNGLHRYDLSNGISIVNTIVGTTLGIIFIYYGHSIVAFVAVRVVVTCITVLISLLILKNILPEFSLKLFLYKEIWNKIKLYIGYGVLLRLSGLVLGKMDQALIGRWISIGAAGLYAIPILITTSIGSLISSLITFTFPIFSEFSQKNERGKIIQLYKKGTRLLCILSILVYFPLILYSEEFLTLWVGIEIGQKVTTLIILLSISGFISTIFVSLTHLFVISLGHMRFYTSFVFTRSIILVLLFMVFIKNFGIEGAGVSMLLCNILDIVFFIYSIKKFLESSPLFYFRLFLIPLTLGVLLLLPFYLLKPFVINWLFLGLFSFGFVLVFLLLLLICGQFSKDERRIFTNFIQKKFINNVEI